MKSENSDLSIVEGSDEIYTSPNIVIQWLGNRLIRAIMSLMPKMEADTLSGLNVGCGEGQMISRLFQSGMRHKMTAMDIDPVRIAFANQHNPVCDYVRADIFHLPFKSQAFDYVIATEILEHLSNPSAALKEIAKLLKDNASLKLYVVGHTDNTGMLEANMKLSQDRAVSVMNALVSKYSVDATRLKACGDGPTAPVTSNDSEEGRALNRRVELVKQ